MKTDPVYWIEGPWQGCLAILPRPRGGDWLVDEVHSWKEAGINVVVSLLTPNETSDLELTQESKLIHNDGLEFLSFPIVDRSIPTSRGAALEFVRKLGTVLDQGKHVGVHCRQGIGRSAVIAASLLVVSGLDPEIAFQRVSDARGVSVPETPEQKEWVFQLSHAVAAYTPQP
jgi:protein-tyrosine phosphatase